MRQIFYSLLAIDETGTAVVDLSLSPDVALQVLMSEIATGRVGIAMRDDASAHAVTPRSRTAKKKGKKHAKRKHETIPVDRDELADDVPPDTDIGDELDRETFDKVHVAFEAMQSTQDVAEALSLPQGEVNRAMKFKQYAAYVRNRISS